MKLTQIPRLAFMLGLISFSNISCAADPVRPATSTTTSPATSEPTHNPPSTGETGTADQPGVANPLPIQPTSFKVNSDGSFVPVTKDGREFKTCGTLEKNTCAPFTKKVTLNDLKFTTIAKIDFSVNPKCQIWVIVINGRSFVYYDPTDPNCPKFN